MRYQPHYPVGLLVGGVVDQFVMSTTEPDDIKGVGVISMVSLDALFAAGRARSLGNETELDREPDESPGIVLKSALRATGAFSNIRSTFFAIGRHFLWVGLQLCPPSLVALAVAAPFPLGLASVGEAFRRLLPLFLFLPLAQSAVSLKTVIPRLLFPELGGGLGFSASRTEFHVFSVRQSWALTR